MLRSLFLLRMIKNESLELKNVKNKMEEILGTKVNISQKANGKGKIEIAYASGDEFERLIGMINRLKK